MAVRLSGCIWEETQKNGVGFAEAQGLRRNMVRGPVRVPCRWLLGGIRRAGRVSVGVGR